MSIEIGTGVGGAKTITPDQWGRFAWVESRPANSSGTAILIKPTSSTIIEGSKMQLKNVQYIDLTQMLGTDIAEYIYSLEHTNAGAGVSFFREFFPADYYDYNAGELLSVSGLQSHKTTGNGWERTYPLDSSLTLRGIPKLNSNNNLYYDGDEYSPDGTVTRKYGFVDMGTLNWFGTSQNRFFSTITDAINTNENSTAIICEKYVAKAEIANGNMWLNQENIYIVDSNYSTAESFKTAMSGVYLVYELETPTTETATPYTDPQEVSANGTEQYVTNSIIPVGHETEYLELVEV